MIGSEETEVMFSREKVIKCKTVSKTSSQSFRHSLHRTGFLSIDGFLKLLQTDYFILYRTFITLKPDCFQLHNILTDCGMCLKVNFKPTLQAKAFKRPLLAGYVKPIMIHRPAPLSGCCSHFLTLPS